MSDTTHRFWDEPATLRLLIIAGAAPSEYPLRDGMTLLIGRGKTAAVLIDHPSLSREHASITVRGDTITLEDKGSRNGTRVRGDIIAPHTPVVVNPGDTIVLGAVLVALQGPSASHVRKQQRPIASPPPDGPMVEVFALAELAAPAPVAVLLLGETGVGKTTIAEHIHVRSGRAGELVRVNCAAVPEPLLESELFGYEKGAFSGAQGQKLGLIEVASSGTLLLDEIGDMPLATQAKLLHVVEHGEVMRLGALKPRKVDVRLIAATHRNLTEMVERQTFRADLYYRINGIAITIPPLRARRSEIIPLAEEFLGAICQRMNRPRPTLSAEARAALLAHPWNGNLRELKNVMDRAALLMRGGEISPALLGLAPATPSAPPHAAITSPPTAPPPYGHPTYPPYGAPYGAAPGAIPPPAAAPVIDPDGPKNLRADVESFERDQIVRALEATNGNQTRAAQMLNMPLRTFVKRLTRYGLTKSRRS